ncbi:amino acid adenylation domain-containing protein [Paraburkholderia acidisoli]|uniref:Amino acid adenylation domain-containing protein n=2 Tax=Paraburkholderia acidisoli TaxID=2571748 RepID=A0A7Z2GJF6_9BURK|nr:amino acid adenylation domain-containing protein [Paraburkholderia acidisoli]
MHHAAGVIARFEATVAQFGDRIAAVDATGEDTYASLDARSARLAHVLAERGLAAGERCAIMVPRSRDTLALILAILRAGAVYVPLDPAYPKAQLDFIVADCAPKLIVADSAALASIGDLEGNVIDLADLLAASAHADAAATQARHGDDAAYIMYTSGSTGKPKGVIVPHRAISRLVHGQTFTELAPHTRFLNLAPLAFDASTLEIWGPLLNGGCAAIIGDVQPSLDVIAAEIARLNATTAWFTAGLFNALADYRIEAFAPLKEALTGGDVLSPVHVRKAMDAHPALQIVNGYGPTENTTFTCCYRVVRGSEALANGEAIPVGYAIAGTTVHIVDEKLAPVAAGEVGELVAGGAGVALGYLNRPELSAEKFVDDPFAPGGKLYRTGDLVRRRADGAIEFLGRNDRQIKIAGKRIELDEIEHALRVAPGVADAAVAAFENARGKAIAGFVKSSAANVTAAAAAIRAHLKAALPDYMMPTELRVLPDFPLTPNGKIDRKALLASLNKTDSHTEASTPAGTDIAAKLAAVFEQLLGKPVDRHANFFDLGLRSLDLMRAHAIIARDVTAGLALVDLFRHPNVAALAAQLHEANDAAPGESLPRRAATSSGAIAVVGMSGRFPGARNVGELWANILAGRDCVTHFDVTELEDSFDDKSRRDASYVKARPILPDVDRFDAGFFGMLAREAALTDPQQRLFLEIAWEAFEDAGYDPAAISGAVGVFAGTSMNTYFLKHVLTDRAVIDEFTSQFQIGEYQKLVGAGDFVATRTAYKLGLTGPAVSVQTACSTSLTAIGLAVENLRAGRCEMALAGGVSITFPQKRGYFYQEGGMGAPDGVCRPFDANAQGTVFGSGAGVVLLKRLEDAIADADPIYAVIRGVGINNDGADKVGFTAPSVDAQARAVAIAHAEAGIDPASIGYIEAHGTATPLGDPIEFAGLVQAFRLGGVDGGQRGQFCALGSAKANVGHLDAAAGVTGLIAASLALRHRTLPPLTHFSAPNPAIELANSPFFFNVAARAWQAGEAPRRAGVSSLGVGGTNVHVVLEEAPEYTSANAANDADEAHDADNAPQILPVSARSAAALERAKANLAAHLSTHADAALADVAATLQTGRRAFTHRAVVVAENTEQAQAKLAKGALEAQAPQAAPPVVFMFPGQGSQYPGMGDALYRTQPVYRQWIDKGAEVLAPHLGLDIRTLMFSAAPEGDDTPHPIRSTIYAQPALFLVEYALAQLWIARGIKPTAMIGHSVGELVAACVAEAIAFEDALYLIAQRGALMQAAEPGAMLVVRLPEAELTPILPADVDLAALNAPSLSVVAGPFAAIEAFEATLKASDIEHRRLHTSHAFHSRMMSGVVDELAKVADTLTFALPKIPYVSSVTGEWASAQTPVTGHYWATHCRNVVRFGDALATATASADSKPLLLEIGPGRTLATFATQGLAKDRYQAAIASLPDFSLRERELALFAEATGRLWLNGVTPDWKAVQPHAARRVSLPTYPFEPERHWIDAPAAASSVPNPLTITTTTTTTQAATLASASAAPASTDANNDIPQTAMDQIAQIDRKPRLIAELAALLAEMSGEAPDTSNPDVTFWDLGYDSLFMGQVSRQLRRRYDVTISFRQIMSDYPTLPALAGFLDGQLPPDPAPVAAPAPVEAAAPAAAATPAATPAAAVVTAVVAPVAAAPLAVPFAVAPATGDLQSVIRDQLAAMQMVMARQLDVLQGVPLAAAQPAVAVQALAAPVVAPLAAPVAAAAVAAPAPAAAPAHAAGPEIKFEENRPSRFTAYKPGVTPSAQTTDAQTAFIADFAKRYSAKSPTSKSRTQTYRAVLADPRTASGFREEWKELVYPIVAQRSKGSKIWDIDGNEYVDVVNGYGQTAFGHTPDFVVDAVKAQMDEGFAIGPQSPLAGEVAQMFADMTGHQRVTFCNTGSEAVMAAMRLARTVTGKDKVVCFDGDYHGQFDEVLVKPGSEAGVPRAFPLAPGIPSQSVGNMVVLPYAKAESLEWIKANIDDIAAVLIEPVQSRHPNLRPKEFVQQLREVTAANESALIFDEVVTGFRVHPAGMQGYWGIQGDMATYGKVVGGGLPIGVLAGTAQYMDALDGGQWQFGDASVPEVPPTFFAGTFVRHPVVLSAMKAVLLHLKEAGPALQEKLGARMEGLVQRINAHLEKVGIATRAETFSSWFYVNLAGEDRLGSLFYPYMRYLGVHIMEGFPCFLTTSHSDEDIRKIGDAFIEAIDALQRVGIFGGKVEAAQTPALAPAVAQLTQAPLTEPQKEIWMSAQQSHEASCAFNESFTLELSGNLNEAAFERAFAATVARHDALRVHFSRVGDTMIVDPATTVPLVTIDLAGHADAAGELAAIVDGEARAVFDLTRAPLVRAALIRLESQKWAFVFTGHHIVCDGWSINIILRDLAALYEADVSGKPAELDEVQSFLAYAKEQHDLGVDAETRDFWLNLHREPAPQPELPGDRARPEIKSFNGASTTRHLSADLLKQVKTASSKQGCSLFATLFGAAQVLFGRLANNDDVVIAAPMAGQSQAGEALLAGHCVNFLPLRVKFDRQQPFATHMKAVRDHVYDAGDRQNYTYGALVRDLGIKRDFSRLPLTDLQFNLEKVDGELDMAGVTTRFAPNAKAYSNFDLFLNVIESAQGLRLDCDFITDVYDEATVQRWLGHYETLLAAIAADADTPIAALPLLSDAEIHHLRDELNASQRDFDLTQTTPALIAAQAQQTPDAPAVADAATRLSYAQLDACANQIARALVAAGVTPRSRVAVAMSRGAITVAAMIGVWRAGCAYVPLDMTMPAARLTQILDNAGIAAILSDGASRAVLEAGTHRVLEVEALLAADTAATTLPAVADADSAYVIFTSGSTGQPKGVEIGHRALSNFLLSVAQAPGFTASDRIVAVTTFSFDISGLELFLPLIAGGQTFVAGHEEVRTGFELVTRLHDEAATVLQATPSLWRMLLEAGFKAPQGFKILCGGEPLPRDLADDLLATGADVWNLYGPTETTIWSSASRVAASGPIVIGAPLANTDLHVLTEDLRLAPVGVTGELWIGGEGLAKGYFNGLVLTNAAFQTVAIEGAAPRRLYRTGDLAKRLADGSLQHLGRRDQQIKLRGFRIEIEDIEAALRKSPGVTAAAVALHTVNGSARLTGYLVGTVDQGAVAAQLAERLPAYMVPTLWMTLDALPQTSNGKLDRKALPVPTAEMVAAPVRHAQPTLKAVETVAAVEPVAAVEAVEAVEPGQASATEAVATVAAAEVAPTATEATLAAIWGEVLGLQHVGTDQKFFSLGADSLQLFRIVARMNERGLSVDARQLMKNVTIAELAATLDGKAAQAPAEAAPAARPSILNFKRRVAEGV